MGLIEKLKGSVFPGIQHLPSFDDSFLREALLQAKGKAYYQGFKLEEIESRMGTEKVIIHPGDDDPMIGERHNDGVRRFNEPTVHHHIDHTGTGFSQQFMDEYKDAKRIDLIARIYKGHQEYEKKYPILMDIFAVLMDSIVTEGKRCYSRDMQEPMAKFIQAETFVDGAIDALDDPRILESMVLPGGTIKDPVLEKKLRKHSYILNDQEELDIGKLKGVLHDFGYLNIDHERNGKQVYLSPEGKRFCKVGIMKGIFGKTGPFQIRTPLKAVEKAYLDSIIDLKEGLQDLFRYSPVKKSVSKKIWEILTIDSDYSQESKEERLALLRNYAEENGKDIEGFLNDHYRPERANKGDGRVRFEQDAINGAEPIRVDKIRGFRQLIDEYDRRAMAAANFKKTYLVSDGKPSVYDHLRQVVELSPYSKTPGKIEENPNRILHNQIAENLGDEYWEIVGMMDNTSDKKKVLSELYKKMGQTYIQVRQTSFEKAGLLIQDERLFGLRPHNQMDRAYTESLWENLMFDVYTGDKNDERTAMIKRFAAYKNLADIVQVP